MSLDPENHEVWMSLTRDVSHKMPTDAVWVVVTIPKKEREKELDEKFNKISKYNGKKMFIMYMFKLNVACQDILMSKQMLAIFKLKYTSRNFSKIASPNWESKMVSGSVQGTKNIFTFISPLICTVMMLL